MHLIAIYLVVFGVLCLFQTLFYTKGHCPRCNKKVDLNTKQRNCSECKLGYVETLIAGRNDVSKIVWNSFHTNEQIRERQEAIRREQWKRRFRKVHNWTKEGF